MKDSPSSDRAVHSLRPYAPAVCGRPLHPQRTNFLPWASREADPPCHLACRTPTPVRGRAWIFHASRPHLRDAQRILPVKQVMDRNSIKLRIAGFDTKEEPVHACPLKRRQIKQWV